jgi:hypothetical protein
MGADSRPNAAGSDAKLTTNHENQITNVIKLLGGRSSHVNPAKAIG